VYGKLNASLVFEHTFLYTDVNECTVS